MTAQPGRRVPAVRNPGRRREGLWTDGLVGPERGCRDPCQQRVAVAVRLHRRDRPGERRRRSRRSRRARVDLRRRCGRPRSTMVPLRSAPVPCAKTWRGPCWQRVSDAQATRWYCHVRAKPLSCAGLAAQPQTSTWRPRLWVLDVEASVSRSTTHTQRITLSLTPRLVDAPDRVPFASVGRGATQRTLGRGVDSEQGSITRGSILDPAPGGPQNPGQRSGRTARGVVRGTA